MKAKLSILVFILMISLPLKGYSQDFNLFNPGNELYLFSAYDEGANAFRYNPAVLGLGHKLNVTINAFLKNANSKIYLSESEILVNSGFLGLAYRSYIETPSLSFSVNQYSLGFGFGNKTFSAGLCADMFTYSEN